MGDRRARLCLWHRRHRGPERGAAWVGAAQLGMAAGVPACPAAGADWPLHSTAAGGDAGLPGGPTVGRGLPHPARRDPADRAAAGCRRVRRCGRGHHDVQHLLRLPAELPGDYWAGPAPSSTCCRARRPGGRVDGRARLRADLRSRRPPIGADRRCAGSAAADPTGVLAGPTREDRWPSRRILPNGSGPGDARAVVVPGRAVPDQASLQRPVAHLWPGQRVVRRHSPGPGHAPGAAQWRRAAARLVRHLHHRCRARRCPAVARDRPPPPR